MNKYIIRTLTAISLLSPCLASDDLDNAQRSSFTKNLAEFARERISGLYYTNSVAGHISTDPKVYEFLKSKLTEGWNLGEFKFSREHLPSRNDDGYKSYDAISNKGFKAYESYLDLSQGQSVEDVELLEHGATYQYLYKQTQGSVNIILLDNISFVNSALKDRKTAYSYNQLMTSEIYSQLSDKKHKIAMEIIDVKYSNLDRKTIDSKIKLLEEQMANIEEELEGIIADLKKHMSIINCSSWFDTSDNFINSILTGKALQELRKIFQGKDMQIQFLLASERDNNSSDSGHYCYAKMNLNTQGESMKVRIIDPMFDIEQPYIRAICGSEKPTPQQSLQLFTKMSESIGLRLEHDYLYRGDQVLNQSDCGRLSTIYLLSEINNRDATSLSNYDVYLGFNDLEANGYDLLHQTQTATYPEPEVQSWFSRFITGPLIRTPCDFILRTFFSQT
jgi:hypothetical protein